MPHQRAKTLVVATVAIVGFLAIDWIGVDSAVAAQSHTSQVIFTPQDELYSVHLNRSGTGSVVGNFGRILRTLDSGRSWAEQKSGTTKPLTAVSFSDDHHGVVAGGGGTVLRTTNGGQSWRNRDLPGRAHLLDIHLVRPCVAFVAGAFGAVFSTTDCGDNWVRKNIPWSQIARRLVHEKGPVEPDLNAVHFFDDQEGWVGGEFGLLLHTRDAGRTWTARRVGGDLPQVVAIRFADRRNGWAVGLRGTVLHTTDGGRIWTKIDVGTTRDLYSIWTLGRQGMIVGRGVALRTTDSGRKWTITEAFHGSKWLSGVAGTAGSVVAVGRPAAIRRIALAEEHGTSSERKEARP